MSPTAVIEAVRRLNDRLAIAVGAALLLCVLFILVDVALRRVGIGSFGGTDEISGYVMAGATSWGLAYALTALAHVRIDLLRTRLGSVGQSLFDLLALGALAAVAALVASKGWSVLARTLANDARANTPLETPLWIPQSLWWSGWVWFAVCAAVLWIAALALFLRGDHAGVDHAIGARDETDDTE